jgi:hypothetical protein
MEGVKIIAYVLIIPLALPQEYFFMHEGVINP